MASITNSLVTQPPLSGGPGHGNRPMRAILPPITQQQFDQFSHLNTDETVRRVRHTSQSLYISDTNRLFVESFIYLHMSTFLFSDQRDSVTIFNKSASFWGVGAWFITRQCI